MSYIKSAGKKKKPDFTGAGQGKVGLPRKNLSEHPHRVKLTPLGL
jgi:hypothetical protein